MGRPLWHAHDVQSNQYSQKAGAVQKEVAGVTERGNTKSRQSRSQSRSSVENHRLQADCVAQIFLWDENRNQRAACRLIEAK